MIVSWVASSYGTKYSFGLQRLNRNIVKGKVNGLNVDSITLTLVPTAQGENQEVDVYPPGGLFQFPGRIPNGTRFRVYVSSDPKQNTCIIKDSNIFVVQDQMNHVNVSCFSHPVGIYDLIGHLGSMVDEDEAGGKGVSAGAP